MTITLRRQRPGVDALVSLLTDLVSIDSSDPPGNEAAVAARVAVELAQNGIDFDVDEFAPGRVNILARVAGQGTKAPLVFSAHLDTVPIGTAPWQFDPFEGRVVDGRLYGRGSSDMKSGVAAMITALVELSTSEPLAGDVLLALSAGESSSCAGAKRFVERGSLVQAGAILVSEPTSLDVVVAEMAALWVRVIFHGSIGHVSGSGSRNAIIDMSAFLTTLDHVSLPFPDHDLLPAPTISVGKIIGGSAVNVTPDRCEALLDIRLRSGTSVDEVLECLATRLPVDAEVEVVDFKPAVETNSDHPFVQTCLRQCARVTGAAPAVKGVSYYSDATVYQSAHGTPFAILGPGELGMSGQNDEWVSIERVRQAVPIFANIARAWLS